MMACQHEVGTWVTTRTHEVAALMRRGRDPVWWIGECIRCGAVVRRRQ